MNSVSVCIDNREADLLRLWKSHGATPYTLTVEALNVGDVRICQDGKPVIVIERKALADLEASYGDGRYAEQKMRLINCDAPHVVLLVEGYTSSKAKSETNRKRLLSTFCNSMFRDRISVYHTASLLDTFEWIHHTACQLQKNKFNEPAEHRKRAKYTDVIKMSKKANVTPEKALEIQLATIPGVSARMARVVTAQYPTMMDLVEAYQAVDESQRPDMLADLRVDGKQRLASRSAKIYQFISGKRF